MKGIGLTTIGRQVVALTNYAMANVVKKRKMSVLNGLNMIPVNRYCVKSVNIRTKRTHDYILTKLLG